MFLQLSNTENLDFNKGVLKRTAFYITETCPFNIQRFFFSDLKIENYIGKFLIIFLFLLKIGIPLHTPVLLYKSGV